jgi:hypothetical protein
MQHPGRKPARKRKHLSLFGQLWHRPVAKARYPKVRLPVVVTVEPCPSSALKAALKTITQLDCMQAPPFDLKMLEE